MDWLVDRVVFVVPLILSLSVHEWAHARVAFQLGDDTAYRLGRLTLDPLQHIDPVGTLLLPMLGFPIGWAKPVPVQPSNFQQGVSMRTGMMLTAAAGPLSNLVLAVGCWMALVLMDQFVPGASVRIPNILRLLEIGVFMNVALAVFNLLPVPPLDGSRIVDGLVSQRWRGLWEKFSRVGVVLLLSLILLPELLGLGFVGQLVRLLERVLP